MIEMNFISLLLRKTPNQNYTKIDAIAILPVTKITGKSIRMKYKNLFCL